MTRAVLYRTWRTVVAGVALCAVVGWWCGREIDRAVSSIARN